MCPKTLMCPALESSMAYSVLALCVFVCVNKYYFVHWGITESEPQQLPPGNMKTWGRNFTRIHVKARLCRKPQCWTSRDLEIIDQSSVCVCVCTTAHKEKILVLFKNKSLAFDIELFSVFDHIFFLQILINVTWLSPVLWIDNYAIWWLLW